jgi:hypothetical protein
MNLTEFKSLLNAFADNPSDVQFEKNRFLASIRGEDIIGNIQTKDGSLFIEESNNKLPVRDWIALRLADLDTLAKRIIENVPGESGFVDPNGFYLIDELRDQEIPVESITSKLVETLEDPLAGSTKIIYLTSDAGEGKTTVINQLANEQAKKYMSKSSKWLFIPIPLSGRPFLRFDDIVIASLVNRLRFRSFYYESFIELIKHGFLIPAFDGFEEMFMVGSTSEALSATGNMVTNLKSSGTLLFATRKAFFENKGFSSQAKLFDSINSNSIAFSKVTISRWNKAKFIEFASKKQISDPEDVYELSLSKLKRPDHPILTRPVLVNRLITVLSETDNRAQFIEKLSSTSNYFPNFVHSIIEREANTKWIDRSGEPYKPLITVEEHYSLLSLIAEEMWLNTVDEIPESLLEFITDLYIESKNFPSIIGDQIKERIKQHALIIFTQIENKLYKFDHEEFKSFFIGVSLYNNATNNNYQAIISILKRGKLPDLTLDVFTSKLTKDSNSISTLLTNLNNASSRESIVSFIKENLASIGIKLTSKVKLIDTVTFNEYLFPTSCLENVVLENIKFTKCYFQETSLASSCLSKCVFENCSFERLDIYRNKSKITNVIFENTQVTCIYDLEAEFSIYAPEQIKSYLITFGITYSEQPLSQNELIFTYDENIQLFEKVLRKFMRSTQLNENIIKLKLGPKYDHFLKEILPDLLKNGIFKEVDYVGSGTQRRFKLAVKFNEIDSVLKSCDGNYDKFIAYFKAKIQ